MMSTLHNAPPPKLDFAWELAVSLMREHGGHRYADRVTDAGNRPQRPRAQSPRGPGKQAPPSRANAVMSLRSQPSWRSVSLAGRMGDALLTSPQAAPVLLIDWPGVRARVLDR